jgi:uncharacterized membrane protein YidH (DUF202 family)
VEIGVQAERTVLAWRRTVLSVWALAALAVRELTDSGALVVVLGVALVFFGAAFLAQHERRLRHRAGRELVAEPPVGASVLLLTVGCVAVAVVAVVGVFV